MFMRLPHRLAASSRGFSLVEVMVVIALIGVLAGILLVAVGGATDSAKRAQTRSTLESVSAAMDAFRIEHSEMPGLVPPRVLGDGSLMTSSQNVLLHLMGGARVSVQVDDQPADPIAEAEYGRFEAAAQNEDGMEAIELALQDPDNSNIIYNVAVRVPRIGAGPLINGKQYAPYLSPKDSEINRRADQLSVNLGDPANFHPSAKDFGCTLLPDLVDAWGQPIIILRRDRKSGPVLLVDPEDTTAPQFEVTGIDRYLGANTLGKANSRQRLDPANQYLGSRIAPIGDSGELEERAYWLFLLLTTSAMEWDIDGEHGAPYSGTARGGYMLMSPGADGVFMARQDGPIDPSTGAPDLDFEEEDDRSDHKYLESFDDVVFYGGT
ncbi:MAG: prepilin-type N-terminal cleavage/methylation domain-containing protein [Phycisphaerales bacterium]|nr:prepilin-type N-terminal cleavage/methylation domain-containing protein [Phycisphaerales bacterium]